MSEDSNDEFGIAEIGEDEEIVLHPGYCIGWYSHVDNNCHISSCLRSEWCKSYTLTRANQADKSIKRDLDEIGQNSLNNIVEKKASTSAMADLGRQAFFDKVVNFSAENTNHDNIKYNPNRDTASIKIGGHVIVFLAKKKSQVVVQIGGRNKDGKILKIPMGENMETAESQVSSFLKENISQ